MIIRKSAREIELMAAAGAVVAGALALLEERLEPGISMAELDRVAEDYIRSHGGSPDLEGVQGRSRRRPASRRTTMIVHGIPGDYEAKRGRRRLASTSASPRTA